jgi:hypothetical protein
MLTHPTAMVIAIQEQIARYIPIIGLIISGLHATLE